MSGVGSWDTLLGLPQWDSQCRNGHGPEWSRGFPFRGCSGSTAEDEVGANVGSLGSPHRGFPGRIAEAEMGASWYVWGYSVQGVPCQGVLEHPCKGCPFGVTAARMWYRTEDLKCST